MEDDDKLTHAEVAQACAEGIMPTGFTFLVFVCDDPDDHEASGSLGTNASPAELLAMLETLRRRIQTITPIIHPHSTH